MPSLRMTSGANVIELDEYLMHDRGIQVLAGLTGLGLPPVQVQWLEGAGDGAKYRGRRVLARDIDLPLLLSAPNHKELQLEARRLSRMLAGELRLSLVEEDGTTWHSMCYRTGGGDYAYGKDTNGEDFLLLGITVRSGDPYWNRDVPTVVTIGSDAGGTASPFLAEMVKLNLAPSDVIGTLTIDNVGDVPSYPVWKVTGPGTNLTLISPTGETLLWEGTLMAGETLTIDSKSALVVDGTGANRYGELAPNPKFWAIPEGESTLTAAMGGTTSASRITCELTPRLWMAV